MARLSILALSAGIATLPGHLPPTFRTARALRRPLGAALLLLAMAVLCGCATTPVPTDPVTTRCSLGTTEFAGWFQPTSVTAGAVNLNGIANPANSLTFSDNPNCDFYKWSEQMFLWLTSPAPPNYGGGGGHVFQSPVFYDVSPLDSLFDRTLIPHRAGIFPNLSLRASKVGSHGLQVVLDRSGKTLDVEPPRFGPSGRQLILNQAGEPVEIGRATFGRDRQPIFMDLQGRPIERPRPLIRAELDQKLTVQRFTVEKTPLFLNSSGSVVEVENAESDGAVLMSQTGSLVYYSIAVNDVFAYFLTGVKNGGLPAATQFPTTSTEIGLVTDFASHHSTTIPDPEAMAVEVKMSWVEASGLPNPNNYILVTATIPTYTANGANTTWTESGQKTVQMALVAVHVVGFTAGSPGHPEGIWATFEHQGNAPALSYKYLSTTSTTPVPVDPDFSKAWLFCAANPPAGSMFNQPHMRQVSTNPTVIQAAGTFTISPSNTMRVAAWGAAANASPNPVDPTSAPLATAASASSNSEIISINDGVRGLLNSADLRRKYIFTGATWTINGDTPTTNYGNPGIVPSDSTITFGKAVGTNQMANTTLETYQQPPFALPSASSFSASNNNCFSCHTSNTTSVSHIYTTPFHAPHGIKPLFP